MKKATAIQTVVIGSMPEGLVGMLDARGLIHVVDSNTTIQDFIVEAMEYWPNKDGEHFNEVFDICADIGGRTVFVADEILEHAAEEGWLYGDPRLVEEFKHSKAECARLEEAWHRHTVFSEPEPNDRTSRHLWARALNIVEGKWTRQDDDDMWEAVRDFGGGGGSILLNKDSAISPINRHLIDYLYDSDRLHRIFRGE